MTPTATGIVPCPDCGSTYLFHLKGCPVDQYTYDALSPAAPSFLPSPGRLVVEELAEGDPVLARLGGHNGGSNITIARGPQELQPPAVLGRIVEMPNEFDGDMILKVGDVLLFGHNSGYRVDVGYGRARRRAIILRESEVLARVMWDQ